MLRAGHIGIGLIAYSPFGAIFLAVGRFDLFILGFVVALTGARLPDIDSTSPLFKHRGWTHTVWFIGVMATVCLVGTFIMGRYVLLQHRMPPGIIIESGWDVALVASSMMAVGLASHLLGDMITPQGIKPFEPVSPRGVLPISMSEYKVSLDIVRAKNQLANTLFLLLGFACQAAVVGLLVIGVLPMS